MAAIIVTHHTAASEQKLVALAYWQLCELRLQVSLGMRVHVVCEVESAHVYIWLHGHTSLTLMHQAGFAV